MSSGRIALFHLLLLSLLLQWPRRVCPLAEAAIDSWLPPWFGATRCSPGTLFGCSRLPGGDLVCQRGNVSGVGNGVLTSSASGKPIALVFPDSRFRGGDDVGRERQVKAVALGNRLLLYYEFANHGGVVPREGANERVGACGRGGKLDLL